MRQQTQPGHASLKRRERASGNPEVSRAPLLQRVAAAIPKLIVVEAPAGFGKSWVARKIAAGNGEPCLIDALGVADPIEYHQRLLIAMLLSAPREAVSDWEREAVSAARDLGAWRDLCVRVWHEVPNPQDYTIIENFENASDVPEIVATLQVLFDRPHPLRRVIICSRKPVPLRFGRFAFPHEIVRLNQRDLRFDRSALSDLFEVDTASEEAYAIENITAGWPIAAFLLRRLWQEGRRTTTSFGDDRALFSFLADEVLSMLSRTSLEALLIVVLLDDATRADVAAALGNDATGVVERLLAEAPFVDAFGEALRAHPLLCDVMHERFSDEVFAVAKRAAECYEREGNGIRAAQIHLALHDSSAAIAAIDELVGGAWVGAPSYALDVILQQLDRSTLLAYPAIWAFTMFPTGCAQMSAQAWLDEAIDVWTRHADRMPRGVAVGVGSNIINACMNLGKLDEADTWLATIRAIDPGSVAVALWFVALESMRGRIVDTRDIERDVTSRLADGVPKAMFLYDVMARNNRMRGERDEERSVSVRAVEIALKQGLAHCIALTATDAAFGAWLAGEDLLFDHYLRFAETNAKSSSRETTRIFHECARGFGLDARPGYEKLKTRSYAWLVAASQSSGTERVELLRRAREAADASAQPYARILARVAAVASQVSNASTLLGEAAVFAETVDAPRLREALADLKNGGTGGMLSPLVARFRRVVRTAEVQVVRGSLSIDGTSVAMPERYVELLMLLAVQRRPVHREAIVSMLWPDADSELALGALRTLISRLRAMVSSRDIVVTSHEGYSLATDVSVDLDPIRQCVARCEITGRLESEGRRLLRGSLDRLLERDRSRGTRWEWFAATEYGLEALASRIASLLGRNALATKRWYEALDVGRRLLAFDRTDELGCELVVRALIGEGDMIDARREIATFEALSNAEASFLRAFLT